MCCSECVSGSLKTETPIGKVSMIHNLKTYIATPEGSPKGIIVMIPDAFGWEMPNNRLLADQYARDGGYLVYLPDFMNGSAVPSSMLATMDYLMTPASERTSKTILSRIISAILTPFHLIYATIWFFPFLYYARHKTSYPRILAFFHALRENPSTKDMKIFVAGFCWGGRYTTLLAGNPPLNDARNWTSSECPTVAASQKSDSKAMPNLIDAAFTAHPSRIVLPDEIQTVKSPLSIIIGDTDAMMDISQVNQMRQVLA